MLKGSIVALITPMKNDGELDIRALSNLIDFHVLAGTSAIVSVGTSGESATLDNDEHLNVIATTIKLSKGRIPIIAGTGANSTQEAVYLTKESKKLGADACLLVTPYYNKPTQEGLFQHHKTIAKAVDIDQILYNVPSRTAVDMNNDTISRLSEIPNIIGVKDATGDLSRTQELRDKCGSDFLLFSGDDASACEFILKGGDGGISVTANVAPDLVQQVYHLAGQGDTAACDLDAKISDLHRDLFIESNPIPVKWALYKMNKCELGIRLPLMPLSTSAQKTLSATLQKIGLIQ